MICCQDRVTFASGETPMQGVWKNKGQGPYRTGVCTWLLTKVGSHFWMWPDIQCHYNTSPGREVVSQKACVFFHSPLTIGSHSRPPRTWWSWNKVGFSSFCNTLSLQSKWAGKKDPLGLLPQTLSFNLTKRKHSQIKEHSTKYLSNTLQNCQVHDKQGKTEKLSKSGED